jgi:hypothetical protein
MSDNALPSRRGRYIYGGLLASVAVAIILALIFTVGGVGHKMDQTVDDTVVKPLYDTTSTGIDDVLKSLNQEGATKKDEATVPVPAAAKIAPVAPDNKALEKTFTNVSCERVCSEGIYIYVYIGIRVDVCVIVCKIAKGPGVVIMGGGGGGAW